MHQDSRVCIYRLCVSLAYKVRIFKKVLFFSVWSKSEPQSRVIVEEIPTGNLAQFGGQQGPLSPDYGYIGEDEDEPVFYDSYNPPGLEKCLSFSSLYLHLCYGTVTYKILH